MGVGATGGQEPGRIGVGRVWEAREERAGSGSSKKAGNKNPKYI